MAASNAQCEQLNRSHTHHEDCERYGIIIEPMSPLCAHDTPLWPELTSLAGFTDNAAGSKRFLGNALAAVGIVGVGLGQAP